MADILGTESLCRQGSDVRTLIFKSTYCCQAEHISLTCVAVKASRPMCVCVCARARACVRLCVYVYIYTVCSNIKKCCIFTPCIYIFRKNPRSTVIILRNKLNRLGLSYENALCLLWGTIFTWVITVCYFSYSNNKHSLTHHCIYLFCALHHSTPRLCQYATCFGSAEPSSGTCINVKNADP
jgi:hypothetical protein